jgi:hypothetical protein
VPKPEIDSDKYVLRRTDGKIEMQWLVMVTEPNGETDNEWCESEALAVAYAEEAMRDARVGDYPITVFVLKCVRQNGPKS